MRNTTARFIIMLAAVTACDNPQSALSPRPPEITGPAFSLNPSYGLQNFHVSGFSYGPDWEEYDPGSCKGTYQVEEDSVQVWPGPTPPAEYVRMDTIERTGCAIGQLTDGPYVGGNVTYSISNTTVSGSVLADGGEEVWLLDVPKDPAGTLDLTAYANSGYQFVQWVVYPASGGSYFVQSSSISRTLGTSDERFRAEFQKQ